MIDYNLYSYYFQRNGWEKRHLFHIGTKWIKGNQEVVHGYRGFILNGKHVEDQTIIDLLKISEKEIEKYNELRMSGYSVKRAEAFLDGAKWASIIT